MRILKPFKMFVLNNFPFIEEDFDALTNYALLCKIVHYLNNTIAQTNETAIENEKLKNDFNNLKNYVDNYFKNLDVQEEINNKLDEIIEDGTFERLVGDYLIKKLDYYKITTSMTESEIQEIFDINNAKVIEFENGIYNFDNYFHINKNTKILLNGSTLNFNTIYSFLNFYNTDCFLNYEGNSNISIENGKITGGSIALCHAANIKIDNVYFYHINNDHIIQIMACKEIEISNCILEGIQTQTNDRNYVEYIQIDDTTYANFPFFNENSLTYDETPNFNLYIHDNKFLKPDIITYSFYTGIGGHTSNQPTDKYHQNIRIENNYFENYEFRAIRILSSKHVNIKNNYFYNNMKSNSAGETIRTIGIGGVQYCKVDSNYANILGGFIVGTSNNDIIVSIINNIIENSVVDELKEADHEIPLIIMGRGLYIKVSNNIINNCDRAFFHTTTAEVYENDLIIINDNCYNTKLYAKNNFIRLYSGYTVIINNNNFNFMLSNYTTSYYIRLSQNVHKLKMSNNYFLNRDGATNILSLNNSPTDFNDVYDIPLLFVQTGTYTELDEVTNANYNLNNFNKLLVTIGGDSGLNTLEIKSFSPLRKLNDLNYKIPVINSDSENTFALITINATNNKLSISINSGRCIIRNVYVINENV